MPAQRSPADVGARRAEHVRSPRGGSDVLRLALVGMAVTGVVVAGLLLFGDAPLEQASPAPPPVAGTSLATVLLDDSGNVQNAVLSFPVSSSVLHLSVPTRSGPAADFAPSVQRVSVVTDGRAISVDGPIGPGEARIVPLPERVDKVDLVYSTTGTFRSNAPASVSAGVRGLTLLTALVVEEAQDLPTTVRVLDGRVRSIGCVERAVMTTCGARVGSGWRVETERPVDILAQLDLEQP